MEDCRRRKLTSEQVLELVEQHRAGTTFAALARQYGISGPAAAYHCKRAARIREQSVEGRLRELVPVLVDGWHGPGPYGFFLEAPSLREPFLEAVLLANGAIGFDQAHESLVLEPPEHAEAEIADGIFEAATWGDPGVAGYLRDRGERPLRDLIRPHVARIREQIAGQLEGLWFVGAVMAA